MLPVTRRAALGALFAAAPLSALAAKRKGADDRATDRVLVDVSPLRQQGDNTDADYFEEFLPGYLRRYVGAGHEVRARVTSVTYGAPGSSSSNSGNGAVDSIEGVGWVDGRETPMFCTIQTTPSFPDVGGYGARQRQDQLALAFAQWLPRQIGL